jgi:hypothetical protein
MAFLHGKPRVEQPDLEMVPAAVSWAARICACIKARQDHRELLQHY